jgi:hypothetical protein
MEAIIAKIGIKGLLYLVGFLVLSGVLFGVYKHIELLGEHKVQAQVLAATQAESDRRKKVLEDTQAYAQAKAAALEQSEKSNADIQADITRRSAVNDSHACLDSIAVKRLRGIGQSGHQTGHRTAKPAGKAAG